MKRLILGVISAAFIITSTAFAKESIRIIIDGNEISTLQAPVIYNGRTLVPLRAVAEYLNCNVDWDQENKVITLIRGDKIIELQINNTLITVTDSKNAYEILTETPAVIVNNTTMVPIRAVAEIFEAGVEWDNDNKVVKIYYNQDIVLENNGNDDLKEENKTDDGNIEELGTQDLRKISAKLDDDRNVEISFLPDNVNDYSSVAESVNIYFYNRVGTLIYQELGQGITISNNNDYIEYKLDYDDIRSSVDEEDFTTFTNSKIKVEIIADGKVYAQGEYNLGCRFNYAAGYSDSQISMNISNIEAKYDNQNKIKVKFRFYGNCSSENDRELLLYCYDLRGKLVGTVPLGVQISKGEFDFEQYYTLPSATSDIYVRPR